MLQTLDTAAIVQDYRAGRTLDELADAHKTSRWTIKDRLDRVNEPTRRRGPARKYSMTERFFENIQTEAQAYWLGFLMADGHVSQEENCSIIRIRLSVVDRGHLVKLKQAVASESPIEFDPSVNASWLALYSAAMCRDLIAAGVTPEKSKVFKSPELPEHLWSHYYRGCSDGDGSLHQRRPRKEGIPGWAYGFIGIPGLSLQYQQWLMTNAQVRRTKLDAYGPVSRFGYNGSHQVLRICNALYANATVYLDRKFERYQRLLASKGLHLAA